MIKIDISPEDNDTLTKASYAIRIMNALWSPGSSSLIINVQDKDLADKLREVLVWYNLNTRISYTFSSDEIITEGAPGIGGEIDPIAPLGELFYIMDSKMYERRRKKFKKTDGAAWDWDFLFSQSCHVLVIHDDPDKMIYEE